MDSQAHQGIWTYLPNKTEPAANNQGTVDLDAGFDFAVKANIEVAGMPASAGSPVFEGHLPELDSPVVAILKRHGGRVAGLTNMHEMAFGITSNNATYGPVRNPFDPLRSAGGSSGGSAAAVAAGLVPISLGTDTGGSISIPATVCGVVGFRPTTGRWPGAGSIGLSWTRDTIGLHTTLVAHAQTIDSWITHHDRDVAQTHHELPVLGIPTAFTKDLDPSVARRFAQVREHLSRHLRIIEVDLDEVFAATDAAQWDIVGFEAPRVLSAALAAALNLSLSDAWENVVAHASSPDVRGILEAYAAHPIEATAYAQSLEHADSARTQYLEVLSQAGVDALIFPSIPALPSLIGQDELIVHQGEQVPLFPLFTRHVGPGTVLGVPSVSLPVGLVDVAANLPRLPVGINLQGFAHRDPELLAIAARVEALLKELP
ncbi:amidase [Arthrobacter sp. MYb227]|uniref:amidase family protein n=1 Tax=Arthrobacter sp. MYb227 TaxID=1848601 RepID=UPI000CFDAE8B|nr:amidase family protein [Arthrobacter sp. MYb227]PQZ93599.1 amidase [Arthrobacter sp. MYb227]